VAGGRSYLLDDETPGCGTLSSKGVASFRCALRLFSRVMSTSAHSDRGPRAPLPSDGESATESRGSSGRFKHHLGTIAIETFSVVLGIVLALAANAWHDRRAHDEQARVVLQSIRAEVMTNRAALAGKLPYHDAMHDSLAALIARTHAREIPGGLAAISNWRGLQPTRLLDDAWQTARSTQVLQYLPYDVVLSLSRTYATQLRLSDIDRALFGAIYTPAFATGGVAAVAAMSSYLQDVVATEQSLAATYDAEIKQLDRTIEARAN
jgi:hypothetical protein